MNDMSTENSLFEVFPNPSNGRITISFADPTEKESLVIVNLLGEKIYESSLSNDSKKEITLSNISSGIYFIKVNTSKKQYYKRFIVQ